MIDPELLIQRIDALADELFGVNPQARDQYHFVLRGQLVAMIAADPDKMGTIAAANDGQICRMLELNIAKIGASDRTEASPPLEMRVPPPGLDAPRAEPETAPDATGGTGPRPAGDASQPRPKIIYCCQCGAVNPFNNRACVKCGTPLHEPVKATDPFPRTPTQSAPDPTANPLFPSKNPNALIGYYLGVFSIAQLLCMGVPILSIPAFIFGILGMQHERKHPEARGGIHALVGVVLGAIMTLISAFILLGFIIGMSHRRRY